VGVLGLLIFAPISLRNKELFSVLVTLGSSAVFSKQQLVCAGLRACWWGMSSFGKIHKNQKWKETERYLFASHTFQNLPCFKYDVIIIMIIKAY